MEVTDEVLEFIKKWEGFRERAYLCPSGRWTIGYGHTKTARPNMQVTRAEAEALLRQDVEEFVNALRRMVHVPLSPGQSAALISWAFNIGAAAAGRSTLIRKLNEGRYDEVPAQLRRWVFINKERSQGLINRREAEVALWNRRT